MLTETAPPEPTVRDSWQWWKRVAFRFAFILLGEICIFKLGVQSQVLWLTPWIERLVLRWPLAALAWPIEALSSWLTSHVFHVTGEAARYHASGSGDKAQDWIFSLAMILIALAASLLWSAIGEWGIARRGWSCEYRTLYAWLRLIVRFALASTLISYGLSKVFDLQFSPPGPYILEQTYGSSSPMTLLWTFMGYSVPYTVFAGIAEVIPGILLLFRRTMTVGALCSAAVLLNVVLLNFCYDVPVKLYSTTYFAMALFLLLPDIAPMVRFFFGRERIHLTGVWLPPWERKSIRVAGYCLQSLVILHLIYAETLATYDQRLQLPATNTPPSQTLPKTNSQYASVDGTWTVDASNGWPSGQEWTTVTIGQLRYQSIDFLEAPKAGGTLRNYGIYLDWDHKIHFLDHPDSVLRWRLDSNGNATLDGTWLGRPAVLKMHHLTKKSADPKSYPLMTRGFHWVQEYPH